MSDHRSEPDHPDGAQRDSESDRLVESLLKRLEPNPLERDLIDRLQRSLDTFRPARAPATGETPSELEETSPPTPPARPRPARLVLLTLASAGALAAYVAAHRDLDSLLPPERGGDAALSIAGGGASPGGADHVRYAAPSSEPLSPGSDSALAPPAGFLPVSRQGLLVGSSHQEIVETEEGASERRRLDYRDAYHWHDPESGTNLRLYAPRSESVLVPLRTD